MERHPLRCDAVETEEQNEVINRRLAIDLDVTDKRRPFCFSLRKHTSDMKNVFSMFWLFIRLAVSYAKANKMLYCVSFISVLLVVAMFVLLLSVILNLPLIFLRLGDANRGQNDLVLQPATDIYTALSLNYSVIEGLFPPNDSSRGYHAPRIKWATSILKYDNCKGIANTSVLWFGNAMEKCEKGCVDMHCGNSSVRYLVYALNIERESRMGFGFSMRDLKINKGEVVLSTLVAKSLNVVIGDTVLLHSDFGVPFREAFETFNSLRQKTYTIMKMKVVNIVEPDSSKISSRNFVLINYDSSLADIAEGLAPDVNNSERMELAKFNPKECASTIHFNTPVKTRQDVYASGDYVSIRRSVTLWASSIVDSLGFDEIIVRTPTLFFLLKQKHFLFFINLLVYIILFSLAFLSLALLYSLLNLTLETHTYELGVKRMVGFSKMHLVLMLFVNAYFFIIPAWLFGLLIGHFLYLAVRGALANILNAQLPFFPVASAYGWATLAGLVFPLISFVFPVILLISQKLSDALSAARGRNVGVVYKIQRQKSFFSFNYSVFVLGAIFTFFGFMTYTYMSEALLRPNNKHLLYIFFAVLLCMMIGLLILCLNIERPLQTILSYLFFFWESAAVFHAFQKSLIAHKIRNRKITLIYSFSLAFVILVTIAFGIQLSEIRFKGMSNLGTEIVVKADSLDWSDLARFALYMRKSIPEVTGFSYLTRPASFVTAVWYNSLLSLGRYKDARLLSLFGISPNYFEISDRKFLRVYSYIPECKKHSMGGVLYSKDRNLVIMSTASYSHLESDSLDQPIVLSTARTNFFAGDWKDVRFAVKPSAVLSASSQITMSEFRRNFGDSLVSVPNVARYTGIDYLGVRSIPVGAVSIHISDLKHLERVSMLINNYFGKNQIQNVRVTDALDSLSYLVIADDVLGFFVMFTQLLTLVLCFFALFASIAANVANSTKEIGIYRCIGMTRSQVHRIFMWEAFVVVTSAWVMGVFSGTFLGYMMYLQKYLFTQLGFPFTIPYFQLAIAFIVALISAVLSSYIPVEYLLRLPSVTDILRIVC